MPSCQYSDSAKGFSNDCAAARLMDSPARNPQQNTQAKDLLEQRAVMLQGQLFQRQVFRAGDRNDESRVFDAAVEIMDPLAARFVQRHRDSQQGRHFGHRHALFAIQAWHSLRGWAAATLAR